MEMYPAILMHILVEIWGNPYEIKNITLSAHEYADTDADDELMR